MAFQNEVFPEFRLIHGMSRTRQDSTVVFGNGYNEYRIRRGYDPHTWTFPSRDILATDAKDLINFYNKMQGSMDSFKMRDPDDHKWVDFELEHHVGENWKLTSPSGSFIYHPFGAISIKFNGSSVGTTLVVTVMNGVPTIQVSGSHSGSTVTISGQFYYAARFASTIAYSVNALDINNDTLAAGVGDIVLREVREYA